MAFDFDRLQRDLVRASKRALAEVKRTHSRDEICAFALYSDDGAMTVCPSIDLASARVARLAGSPDFPGDAMFAPAEWALESVGADDAFDKLSERLANHRAANPKGFASWKRDLFATCVDALAALRDGRTVRPECLLLFAVSDAAPTRADRTRFARLNPDQPALLEAYRAWIALQ